MKTMELILTVCTITGIFVVLFMVLAGAVLAVAMARIEHEYEQKMREEKEHK